MSGSWVVKPETVRLDLSDGHIIVKKEINAGEQRRVFSDFVKQARSGEPFELDAEKVGLTKIVAYLLDWSAVDDEGKPVEVTPETIKGLHLDIFREIKDAIDAHDLQMDTERQARKNEKAGTLSGAAISASPS